MPSEKLTPLGVKALVKPGRYGDGGGLWLEVRSANSRSWLFRYRSPEIREGEGGKGPGRLRQMGLGPFPAVGLAEARRRARECQALVAAGVDPLEQQRRDEAERRRAEAEAAAAEARRRTFREVALAYIEARAAEWRNDKHRAQWRATLETYAFPVIGDRPVGEVTAGDVYRVLHPIWDAKPETAARVRGRMLSVLRYAAAADLRPPPAMSVAELAEKVAELLGKLGPRKKAAGYGHHAALPWREVGTFLARVRGQEGVAARALEFAILTAARTGEVIGARWGEVDLAAAVWRVPADRMKGGEPHAVPLSEAALAVLRRVAPLREDDGPDALVFPGARRGRPLSNMSMLMLLRRMGRGDLTVHGFRSSFKDWSRAQGWADHLSERALAHTDGNKVRAAYARDELLEERRPMMEAWAEFCARERPAGGGVVVELRRA